MLIWPPWLVVIVVCRCCENKANGPTIYTMCTYEKHQKTHTHTHTYAHTHTGALGRQSVNSHGRTNNVSWQAAAQLPTTTTATAPTTIEGWSYIACACVSVCACIAIRAYQKPNGGHAVIDPPPSSAALPLLLFVFVVSIFSLYALYALLLHYCVFFFKFVSRSLSHCNAFILIEEIAVVTLKIQWNFHKAIGHNSNYSW